MNEKTLKYAKEQLKQLRKHGLIERAHKEDKLKDGDKVRWYLNPHEYITGVVVEVCNDGTVWVEHSNGQQRHYDELELVPDRIMVHGAMKYTCENCGGSWWMFLEKGIEEPGDDHKPSPFVIRCKCGGSARDVSGICKIPGGGYKPLPEGESYFANRTDSDCGIPVLR